MGENNTGRFAIKTYSKKELVLAYGVSPETFRKWLKEAGIMTEEIKKARLLHPQIVQLVVDKLGEP